MHRFEVVTHDKRESIFNKYAWVIYAVWLLVGAIHFFFFDRAHASVKLWVPALSLISSLLKINKTKHKIEPYVQIDTVGVSWLFPEFTRKEAAIWADITWIQLKGFHVIFYRENSFSRTLDVSRMPWEDQKKFYIEFEKEISIRNIKYVTKQAMAV